MMTELERRIREDIAAPGEWTPLHLGAVRQLLAIIDGEREKVEAKTEELARQHAVDFSVLETYRQRAEKAEQELSQAEARIEAFKAAAVYRSHIGNTLLCQLCDCELLTPARGHRDWCPVLDTWALATAPAEAEAQAELPDCSGCVERDTTDRQGWYTHSGPTRQHPLEGAKTE